MISLDTETTGVDLRHGARPFFVTTCTGSGEHKFWPWEVDPLTRQVQVPDGDLQELADYLFASGPAGPIGDYESPDGGLILQNAKFDFAALAAAGFWDLYDVDEVWRAVQDTLTAGHVLESNRPHNLTDMAVRWLGINIQPYEDRLKEACQEARRYCRSHLPDWRIAKDGLPEMPSAKAEAWKYDLWLPRALARELGHPEPSNYCEHVWGDTLKDQDPLICTKCNGHRWWILCAEYSNADSAVTVELWKVQRAELYRRGLWEIYREQIKVLPVVYRMEQYRVTMSRSRTARIEAEFRVGSAEAGRTMTEIAQGYEYELELPANGINNSLRRFCFGYAKARCNTCGSEQEITRHAAAYLIRSEKARCTICAQEGKDGRPIVEDRPYLDLPQIHNPKAKTAAPTLNKGAIDYYLGALDPTSDQHRFIQALRDKRSRDTALAYIESYRKFWRRVETDRTKDTLAVYPTLNPTGTATLRFTSSNPNEQQISKKEGFNLRECFGPAPGREWYSFDYENIELRIPAYKSGQKEFIDLFERSDEPPYYGSNHLLIAHLLFPREFEQCLRDGVSFKERYKATLYQRVKNGNFAVQYGAVDRADGQGTADRTYGLAGAQAKIKARFAKQEAYNQACIRFAQKHGYVETLPDKTVNPHKGYPLLCTRTDYNEILPTVPLNYVVQGTAMWCTRKAMIRVDEFFSRLNRGEKFAGRTWPGGYYLIMQVHDELDVDMPKGKTPSYNLPIAREIRRLMELSGDDIGIPLRVGIGYHPISWAREEKLSV